MSLKKKIPVPSFDSFSVFFIVILCTPRFFYSTLYASNFLNNEAKCFHGFKENKPRFKSTYYSEPVFLNFYGAQESFPRNEFRQPM
jgi:hypothetical protein